MLEFIDTSYEPIKKTLKSAKIDGAHWTCLYDSITNSKGSETADNMFANARKVLPHLIDPNERDLSKTLCIGKVQSGKTSFFICTIALAFDNGYDIAYLVGGTKNSLRDQNAERAGIDFSPDKDISIFDINEVTHEEIEDCIKRGKKVVCVVLKNNASNKNLGKLKQLSCLLSDHPSLIVDDEGDEYTPGTPKKVNKGATHNNISEILNNISCCSYLSVTATPQANILISTLDAISPDYVVLVEPGFGYMGGNEFHDGSDNNHVIEIHDSDEFDTGFPDSFKNALNWFIMSSCLKNDDASYSMLVHPSHLTRVHRTVAQKIKNNIDNLILSLKPGSIGYSEALQSFKNVFAEYCEINNCNIDFQYIQDRLTTVLSCLSVEIVNGSTKNSVPDKDQKYKIIVGGEILGRGLTIPNLCCTYIYRDSKESPIDSLYQRARWFGYKKNYFDICRVYMTPELKKKFIAIVESENDMWNSIKTFLEAKTNFMEFPRIFTLSYYSDASRLILTRKTVSSTITLERVNPGFSYDKTTMFKPEALINNRDLVNLFISNHSNSFKEEQIGTSSFQTHLVIDMPYKDFYSEFLSNYMYQENAKLGPRIFKDFLDESTIQDIKVIIMRYKTGEQRSLDASGYAISELPQGYDIKTNYPGDKVIYSDKFCIQIHLVYQKEFKDFMPIFAVNNPLTRKQIQYVTGDNYYGL